MRETFLEVMYWAERNPLIAVWVGTMLFACLIMGAYYA